MKEIPVYGGYVARVSDHRYEELSRYRWSTSQGRNTTYAICNTKPYLMHLFILPPKDGFCTDHIDNDGLNNVDDNLRYLTHSENIRRGSPGRPNKLGYRGIQYLKRLNKKPYRAEVVLGAKQYHVGYFATLEEAVKARREFLSERGVSID